MFTRARHLARSKCTKLFSTAVHEESDIVIVGAGPAGLALAGALVSRQLIRDSLKITLIEATDLSKIKHWVPPTSGFSNRVSSLTNASQAFLKDIGAWNYVEYGRTCPIDEMQVWDGISDARINFSAAELGLPDGMARLTENLNLQRGLLHFLDQHPSVQILDKTKVQSILSSGVDNGHWPLVHLDNSRVLRARLLVGADGFNSPVRSYADIPSFGWSYETQAIVATMFHPARVSPLNPSLSNTVAFQRFLPTGPIAFLPLSPTASSLVWSTKPLLASALMAAGASVLSQMINAAFRLPYVSIKYLHERILEQSHTGQPITSEQIKEEILYRERSHDIDVHSAYASTSVYPFDTGIPPTDSELVPPIVTSIQEGTIASFPLRFNHTDSYIGQGKRGRTVLVGDAAHTVHPLAGQGLNLGLGDVECLARCIDNSVRNGGDIGSYTTLLPYTQERYFENHKAMSVIDKLHKLYTTTAEPVVWVRSLGLETVNELDFIKYAIMMEAGAKSTKSESSSSPYPSIFSLAASGIQTMAALPNAMIFVRDSAAKLVAGGLRDMVKNIKTDQK